jgi:hypothetical protein
METENQMAVRLACEQARDAASFAVIEMLETMATAHGSSRLPCIPAEVAALGFRAVATVLEQRAAELRALAAMATPGWTVGLTAAELNRASAARGDAFAGLFGPDADGDAGATAARKL